MTKAKRVHKSTTKMLKRGDPGWYEKAQELRDELTKDFKEGKLGVENGWLVAYVEGCTCAGGGPEVNGMHERHCGLEPIQDLVPGDTQFMVSADYQG